MHKNVNERILFYHVSLPEVLKSKHFSPFATDNEPTHWNNRKNRESIGNRYIHISFFLNIDKHDSFMLQINMCGCSFKHTLFARDTREISELLKLRLSF